jgi:hypothetical protein
MEWFLQYGFRRSACGRWWESLAGERMWENWVGLHTETALPWEGLAVPKTLWVEMAQCAGLSR